MDLLLDVLLFLFWWLIPSEVDRRSDLKRLRIGEVRCSIRATERRVLNIGTEWSTGVATIESGFMHFRPATGIVGDREFRVASIQREPTPNALAGGSASLGGASGGVGVGFIITTSGGELKVRSPAAVAEQFAAILAGATLEPNSEGVVRGSWLSREATSSAYSATSCSRMRGQTNPLRRCAP